MLGEFVPTAWGENFHTVCEGFAPQVGARAFNSRSGLFPPFVQHAIWRCCTELALSICNGSRIDDRHRVRKYHLPSLRGKLPPGLSQPRIGTLNRQQGTDDLMISPGCQMKRDENPKQRPPREPWGWLPHRTRPMPARRHRAALEWTRRISRKRVRPEGRPKSREEAPKEGSSIYALRRSAILISVSFRV